MGVLALWRHPVKAMLGELLDAVEIGLSGCAGDRRWIAVDADTGERIANKRGPTDPRLRACRAELVDDSDDELPLRVTLPDGEILQGREIEGALSQLLERRIRLEQADTPALGRIAATGAHHDAAPIHLITTSTLAHLRAIAPTSDWDVRRFRPNLLLDDGTTPTAFAEDALVGGALRGPSGLKLTVVLPTPRCVVPTRGREELPADPGILRTLVQQHRVDLGPFGRQGCIGAYAEVAHAGQISVGEILDIETPPQPPEAAIPEALEAVLQQLSSLEGDGS
jgi:uncharacterized protein YcbX